MSKLYEIDQQIQSLISLADENGEIDMEAFDQLEMEKKDKQLNVIKFIKHLDNDITLFENEMSRIMKMKESVRKRQEWLTKYLENSMRIDGVTELDFTLFKAKFRKNPPKVCIADESLVPQQYIKVKTSTSIDKDQIKQDLKDGKEVTGCKLEQTERLAIL